MTVFRFLFCAHNPYAIGQRWQHMVIFYVIGYLICIAHSGIPHWHYLIPLKIIAIFLAWSGGTTTYMTPLRQKSPINMIANFCLAVRFSISGMLIILISLIPLKIISLIFGIPMAVFMPK